MLIEKNSKIINDLNKYNTCKVKINSLNKKFHILFVYPNGEEVKCNYTLGDSIFKVAKANKIHMDLDVLRTCIVKINSQNKIQPPTQEESGFFSADKLDIGYRYAHTYKLSQADDGIMVFLQLIRITYVDEHKKSHHLAAYEGENMTHLVHRCDEIDLPFACCGNMVCSTCHCVVDENTFKRLPPPSEDEEDMLVWLGSKYSRIGCQINFTKNIDKCIIKHPKLS